MNIKKISAAVMAAAVLAAAAPVMGAANPFGIVASAAEEKLVTGTLDDEILGKIWDGNCIHLGNGYYVLQSVKSIEVTGPFMPDSVTVVDKIIRIGDEEIEKWRSTGKLEPAEVQSDVDLTGFQCRNGDLMYNDNILFSNGAQGLFNVLKIDKDSGKLTKVYDFTGEPWSDAFLSGDGYCVNYENSSNGSTIKAVYSPTGEKITLQTNYNGELYGATGKYVCYVFSWAMFSLYGICPDGSVEEVCKSCTVDNFTYDFIQVSNNINLGGEKFNKIIAADGKTYDIGGSDGKVMSVNGTTAVNYTDGKYVLIDLNNNGKAISKTYFYMSTGDNGKTFRVQTEDGKWGYVDGTGKELALFDAAGSFYRNNLYAPVVKDGKGWLIDRNMNQVSEKIDANNCFTDDNELFDFSTTDGTVFVTSSSKGIGASSDPGKPSGNETALSDKTSGVSVSGDFPAGTTLKASKTKKSDTAFVVDVSPVDANGNKVQPNGAAVVMAVIPELKGKSVNVYRVTDGKYTKMNSWSDGDSIFFTTTHFSEFEITTEQREESNPNTGAKGTVGLAAAALIATGLLVVSKKKR
ncbi:MAG: hypothetical protein K2N56_11395 [Oscillospiraceae bacterium]|nr:hypothetical protein [Oscillospiraceae bacterium]